jgi:hypothetical protein
MWLNAADPAVLFRVSRVDTQQQSSLTVFKQRREDNSQLWQLKR